MLTPSQFKKIEPNVEGIKALWVPESGIIDYQQLTEKLAESVKSINTKTDIITNCKVLDYKDSNIKTSKGDFYANHIIFCGGLFSDRLALKDKFALDMQIVGFRGDYYRLSESAKSKVNNLVYPVPNSKFPFWVFILLEWQMEMLSVDLMQFLHLKEKVIVKLLLVLRIAFRH